jgi:RNA polymerase sigma factor (sigma-70 family)
MGLTHLQGPSAYDSDSDADELLERLNAYIVTLVRTRVPRNVVRPEMLVDEIEDLIQKVRIKLWLTLRKQRIDNLKSYIRCIVYTEVIDLVRRHQTAQSTHPLPVDEDSGGFQGNVIGEGLQSPELEIEHEEAFEDFMTETVEAVRKLPPRQQYAMICSLKDKLDDVLPFIDALRNHSIDVEAVNWPEEKRELQSLRASLSIARKKLQSLKRSNR